MTPEPKTDNTKIACDESGNTGENLTQGQFGVFSEGSHDLSLEEATELMAWLRAELKTQASEIKWKQVKSSPWVFEELFGERLAMRSQFYLTEKLYFVVGKVIDLLLEESIHDKPQSTDRDRDLAAR